MWLLPRAAEGPGMRSFVHNEIYLDVTLNASLVIDRQSRAVQFYQQGANPILNIL